MAKYCPYCGNAVREKDKYCIICGKPLLADLPKKAEKEAESQLQKDIIEAKATSKKEKKSKKETEKEPSVEEDTEEAEEKEKKGKKKEKKKEKEEKDFEDAKPLPEDVKHQIDLYIDFSDLQFNKEILAEKLNKISAMMKDSQYEYDFDYKNKVNVKFQAVKTLINELKQKEKDISEAMDDVFIVQKLNNEVDAKEFQLKNLTREYKLKKIDKATFERLRDRYSSELERFEQERDDLKSGMKLWIQDLTVEKNDLLGKIKLNKGRFSSKEIEEEKYEQNKKDLEFKLKKIKAKIDTLEKLTK